jgi:hypothetical protein
VNTTADIFTHLYEKKYSFVPEAINNTTNIGEVAILLEDILEMEREEESKQMKKKPNTSEKQMKKVHEPQKNSLMETANMFKALGSKELCGQSVDFVREVGCQPFHNNFFFFFFFWLNFL